MSAAAVQPADVAALLEQAVRLHQRGRRDDALESAREALSLAPENLTALNTRGMILDDLGRRQDALADFQRVLSINPHHSGAMTNRAILYAREGRFEEALDCYDRSLSIDPNQLNAIYNRAVIRLVLGDWTRGFREFESRWALFPHEAKRLTRLAPLWLGEEDIKGKTVLLHHEQGFGDTLQFCRYAQLVAQRGARVILAVPAGLHRVLQSLTGSPQIVSEGAPVPPHDFHCPLMSLPLAFTTTPATVPAVIPYLFADRVASQVWGERLGLRRRPRIGLVWSGRRYPPINIERDMDFDAIRPLLAAQADFICLHTELSEDERLAVADFPNLRWEGGRLSDFADTAGLIQHLDLVITVDTAVAHLAGALGKPVWLLNRYASCWRWLLKRSDSPWYPTFRIFRQTALGDWNGVVEEVFKSLAAFLGLFRSYSDQSPRESCKAAPSELTEILQDALDQHNQGNVAQAITDYRRALEVHPEHPEALNYLGVALAQEGRHAEAIAPLSRAVALQPHNAQVHNHYGNALFGLSRLEEALSSYQKAIDCDAAGSEGYYNRGIAQVALGRPEAAFASYTKAIKLNGEHAGAHNNRGNLLLEQGRLAEAVTAYEHTIRIRPTFVDALVNLSHGLRQMHSYERALATADRAVFHGSNSPEAHNCRGAVLADMGRSADALVSYERAIALNPTQPESLWNKGLIKLSRGEYQEGWALAEWRWKVKSLGLIQQFTDKPQLQPGDPIEGKTILLHAEQGYGDTIQLSRYAALLAARGARVMVSAPTPLRSLLKTLPGIHAVIDQGTAAPFDFHCPLMSVPGVVDADLVSVATDMPYLKSDKAARARWNKALGARKCRLRIGLAWAGRPSHRNDANRSMRLEDMLPILQHEAQWISLQKEVPEVDRSVLAGSSAIERHGEQLVDFADTAALIDTLDLVITVDTAVAHLAGALAKRVWILLPKVADWRWLHEGEDSPWYPTARLFRQSERGNWCEVIHRVEAQLAQFMASGSGIAARALNARH